MNTYKFTLKTNATSILPMLRGWLVKNECPNAAKTVQFVRDRVEFVMTGNVSAWSVSAAMQRAGLDHTVDPIGNSQPLPVTVIA